MRSVLFTFGAAKLGGVVLPFPDIPDPPAAELPALPDQVAAPAPKAEPSDSVAPWTAPTMEPDQFASSADAFKHPSAAVVKDWETAPKVEIFEPLPAEADVTPAKEAPAEVALPVVKSKLEPIMTNQKDDDPELSAIQQENPLAYGIVKALLLKKSLGLPLPGAEVSQHHEEGEADVPSSSSHVSNMFAWKPSGSASDGADAELAAVEQSEEVSKAPAPEVAPEPVAPAPAAAPEVASEPVEAPAPVESAPASTPAESSNPLGAFLGTAAAPAPRVVVPAAPAASAAPMSSVLSSYMSDLS